MKILLILTLSMFLLIDKSTAQSLKNIDKTIYEYYYNYEFLNDSTSRYSLKSQEMVLQVGALLSKFTSKNKLFSDSVLAMVEKKEIGQSAKTLEGYNLVKGSLTNPLCNYDVYKNYPQKDSLTFTARLSKTYIEVIQSTHLKWKLIADSDTTILGYHCQKATTFFAKRNYTAWFSIEIPISEGPYKFKGLPGLILKIKDSDNQHCFSLTGIKKINFEKPIFYIQKNYIKITPLEYVKALNVNNAERLEMVQNQTKIKSFNEESKIKAEHNIKSRNNFIEKY